MKTFFPCTLFFCGTSVLRLDFSFVCGILVSGKMAGGENMQRTSRTAQVIRPRVRPGQRVIAISDIHGNLTFLKELLAKIRFSTEDVLVLVGDLLEKGEDSIGVLRYVMELRKTHRVYPLCGNCDHIDRAFLEGRPGIDGELWPVFHFWGERSLIFQLGKELGITARSAEELPSLRGAILEHFPAETEFLLSMPHILEAGNFIFVHGGIPREDCLEELEAYPCMKNDDFMGQGLRFSKWVVVGHWPVTLYDPAVPSAKPLISEEQHVISIDGGCVLKVDGQLNALIIPDVFGNKVEWTAYDGLPEVIALDVQPPSPRSLNIRWNDSAIEVLREDGDCVWCRHISTGQELWILKEYLRPRRADGHIHCEDSTNYLLPVSPGDRLSVVRRCEKGLLAKKGGVTGWYLGKIEE